jgi:arylsulfatase
MTGPPTEPRDGRNVPEGITDATGAYAGFGGRIGRTVAGSEPDWPPRPSPAPDAPNVIVMLADDLGFSDLGCYGSEIDTPHLDAMAASGLRYTDFHVTPMCSPTRAALLTGLNAHRAGVGHVCHSDSGFPGYAMELSDDCATAAEIFGDNGYTTFMVGKWHLAKDSDLGAAGDKGSWPCQRGFERYYGILDGFTNLHQPHRLVRDNSPVEVDRYPDDYYFTDDITDEAISLIRASKASDPTRPFFGYIAHGAVHAPLQAKAADIDRYAAAYDDGWDELRATRLARQKELGIVDPDTPLPPRNDEDGDEVPAWDDLGDRERELFARYMAIYAGMVDNIDQNVGRLRDALDAMGELENTIFVFTSDNGGSREGEESGCSNYYMHLIGGSDVDTDHARLELLGGPQTTPHYPRGWAMASNTPFRLYKINTHAGGHRVPLIVSWPARLGGTDGALRRQYQHVTDVLPTLMELTGVTASGERQGVPTAPLAGASFAASLRDADAASTHPEQYYEMVGHRGMYRDGWEIVTRHTAMTPFSDDEWELYDLHDDPTEIHDLARDHPDKVAELAEAWERAAWENQVYPLDEGSYVKYMQRPERSAVYAEPVTIMPGTPTLERWRSHELIFTRSFTVTVDLELEPEDTGMLVAHGDQGGGYALYVRDGRVAWVHNNGHGTVRHLDAGVLGAGRHTVTATATAPGGGSWDVAVAVDGGERAAASGFDVLFPMAPFEGIDVGIDRRSPVSWEIYEAHGPFPFTGTIHSVRYEPGDPAPDSPRGMLDMLRELGLQFE